MLHSAADEDDSSEIFTQHCAHVPWLIPIRRGITLLFVSCLLQKCNAVESDAIIFNDAGIVGTNIQMLLVSMHSWNEYNRFKEETCRSVGNEQDFTLRPDQLYKVDENMMKHGYKVQQSNIDGDLRDDEEYLRWEERAFHIALRNRLIDTVIDNEADLGDEDLKPFHDDGTHDNYANATVSSSVGTDQFKIKNGVRIGSEAISFEQLLASATELNLDARLFAPMLKSLCQAGRFTDERARREVALNEWMRAEQHRFEDYIINKLLPMPVRRSKTS